MIGLFLVSCGSVKFDDVEQPPFIETCTANEFVDCVDTTARICNATGDGTIDLECGAGCNADNGRCNTCVPGALQCTADGLERCGDDGLPIQEGCAIGCVDATVPHCAYVEPSYPALANACDTIATLPDLTISSDTTLDTTLDATCTGAVVAQTGGPSICIVRYGTITIDTSATFTVRGTRALALVADDRLALDGILDVSADKDVSGPGGGTQISGTQASSADGGGGAGFRTAGGAGGNDTVDGGAANGGAAFTDPATSATFIGGTRAGTSTLFPHKVGGGGGAAILIACRGEVSITGTIDAGGGGGEGGSDVSTAGTVFTGGVGGGSGGNVVLQGLAVSVTGKLFANGGGGGGGISGDDTHGFDGEDGSRSGSTPARGAGPLQSGGHGGDGGTGVFQPAVGGRPGVSAGTGGGGGGSTGFFQTYTPTGIIPTLDPNVASPTLQTNRTITTR